jgi:hypothetical protein
MLTKKAPGAETASSMSVGREGAICEYDEIMQISQVRTTMDGL